MKNDTILGLGLLFLIMFIFCVFLNSWGEDICFYLQHRNAVASAETGQKINLYKEPVQIDLPEYQKMFKIFTHQKVFFIEPKAKYEISGRILSTNMKLGTWGLSRKDFDHIALIDVVLGWGDVSEIKLYEENVKHLKQVKSPDGGRSYWFYLPGDSLWSPEYVMAHTSHNHIVPASTNVMSVLYKIKKYDVVKMQGYLVDIYKDGNLIVMTSLSRGDTDGTSRGYGRGGGSCEVFYVTSIEKDGKLYK